jgi:hypothetical protein
MSRILNAYGVGAPQIPVFPPPIHFQNAPTNVQDNFDIGQVVYTGTSGSSTFYIYLGAGIWDQLSTDSASGNLVVPGTITSTLGNVTATNGNFVASTAGTGIVLTPAVAAAAASPQTANGRSGQVVFSGVSIAAGATQTFVINNTAISAIGTVILYSMTGATQGSALTIESVTNVAGTSSTIVVTNGTGATTSTANITFTFLVLN